MAGPVSLIAVGDIMLGDVPWTFGSGVGSIIDRFGPLFPFEHCWRTLREGDIVFGNLEAVLSRFSLTEDRFESMIFRAQPEAVLGLVKAGFNVLSLANNHIMQHGRQAVLETAEILRANKIEFVGVDCHEIPKRSPTYLEHKGMRVGFLAFNLRPNQYFIDEPLCVTGSIEEILSDIEEAKGSAEHVVVTLHWGDEFVRYPSPRQVSMGRKMIQAGASLVLGHHPHIVQGIERYKRGVIVYSLGNFIFDLAQSRLRKSIIMRCVLDEEGGISYDLIPIEINRLWQPTIMLGASGELWLQEIDKISELIREDVDFATYERQAGIMARRFRYETYWQFLTGLPHFPKRHLLESLIRIVKNRVKRRSVP